MDIKGDRELTAIETCRRLRIDLDYAYRLIWTGKLPARKAEDGTWRVLKSAVEARAAKRSLRMAA